MVRVFRFRFRDRVRVKVRYSRNSASRMLKGGRCLYVPEMLYDA